MNRYLVIAKLSAYNHFLIDAESEEDAARLNGVIVTESQTDTWTDKIVSVREVADDQEEMRARGERGTKA